MDIELQKTLLFGTKIFFVAVVIVYSFQLFVNASFKLKMLYEKKKRINSIDLKLKIIEPKRIREILKQNYNKISDFFVHIYSKLVLLKLYFVNICLQNKLGLILILVCVCMSFD